MRHVLGRAREELWEGEWIIAAMGTVINPDSTEKRLTNDTAKKACEISFIKTASFKTSKIL
jgi:hypothetical protein